MKKNHEIILSVLNEHKSMKVTKLEEIIKIPRTSLLRYLKELENMGEVVKYFGEVSIRRSSIESNVTSRLNSSKFIKKTIANMAAQKVNDGDIVFIDGGSTAYYVAERLVDKKVTIYTTNSLMANLINNSYKPKVYFLPGKVNPLTLAITGGETILSIQRHKFDKAFIGFNSFEQNVFYTTNEEEATVKATAIGQTEKNGVHFVGREAKHEESAKYIFSSGKKMSVITEKGGE